MSSFKAHYTADPNSKVLRFAVTSYPQTPATAPTPTAVHTPYIKKALCDYIGIHCDAQLQSILSEDRSTQIFEHYSPSLAHVARMKKLRTVQPELCIPRGEWLSHENWSLNKQMTSYHIPIRSKMQASLVELVSCYDEVGREGEAVDLGLGGEEQLEVMRGRVASAFQAFRMCTMVLGGHAGKEERNTFPAMMHWFPKVDMKDMFDTHEDLDHAADAVGAMFGRLQAHLDGDGGAKGDCGSSSSSSAHELLADLVDAALQFDAQLNQHLGEEEELLVPMSLVMPEALHQSWPFSPEVEGLDFARQQAAHWSRDPDSTLIRSRL